MPETNSTPAPAAPPVSNPAFAGISTSPVVPKAPEAVVRPVRKAAEPKSGWWWGTGRRKTAVARVRIRPTKGAEGSVRVQIDGKKFKTVEQYFSEERDRNDCYAPLKATNMLGRLDVIIRCSGGGYMGQAGAVLLGISRALRAYDPTLEQALRDHGFLTRDDRDVERKKYGQAGARRRFQFSKR
jgi:small subunit ribosomal protein S9